MSLNPELALTLRARDEASRTVSRVLQETERQTQRAERAVVGLSRESQRMAAAREQLGVRAERAIQREILQTEAAYKRLASSGTLSAREQSRAYDAMRERVAGLRREMAGVSQLQRNMVAGARGLAAVAAGAWAGGTVLANPMRRVASYDMRLAQMANTAFNGTELNGRKLSIDEQLQRRRDGKTQLEAYIRAATAEGGTRDDNLSALDKLIARGIFSPQEAGKMLPMISKAATAAGSSSEEMTGVVMAAVQNAKIPVDQIPKALGMALKAGQMGGFELKDMATWLPKMLAMGGLSGLRGTDGLASILAASQLAVTSAGSTEEAGNNVVNFLQKITSADTAHDFKKIGARSMQDKKKGEKGIDLYGTLAKAREEGIDPVEAFTRLVRKVAEGDKGFSQLQRMAGDAKNDKEKSALYSSMADILQSRGVGKTIQDRQAMLALLPMLFDPKAYRDMKNRILQGNEQDVTTNQQFIKEQPGFKFQQGENLKEQGEYDSIGKLNEAVGGVVDSLTKYGAQYPGLTASIVGATTAVSALAVAAGAASLPMLLIARNRGGGVPSADGLPTAGPAGRSAPIAALARLLGFGMSVTSIANFTSDEEDDEIKNGDARMKKLRATYSQKTIDAARQRYQPWWQFGEGYSKENEGWIKRYLADEAKGKPVVPGQAAARALPTAAAPIPQLNLLQGAVAAASKLDLAAQKMQQATSTPIPVHVTVDVQNGNIVAAVNAANTSTARRF